MNRFALALGCLSVALATHAQTTTNVPLTKIEILETHTQTILIKSVAIVGSVNASDGVVSVRLKDDREPKTSRRLQGATVNLANKIATERIVIDYDELDDFLNGIDNISKVDYDVSPLQSFEVEYITRAGLRLAAYTSRRSETIQTYLQSPNSDRIYLTANQLAEFRSLIETTKTNLDSLREKK